MLDDLADDILHCRHERMGCLIAARLTVPARGELIFLCHGERTTIRGNKREADLPRRVGESRGEIQGLQPAGESDWRLLGIDLRYPKLIDQRLSTPRTIRRPVS
jgi:hypothetical protein